jgi:hypothetical protein
VPQNLAPVILPDYPLSRPSAKIEAVGVVIPAHNQAGAIAKCIHGLFASHSHCGWRNALWIVVVADACTDETAKVAREALGAFGRVLTVSASSLQAAHRIGTAEVLEHFRGTARHALLLTSTSATAPLQPDWIEMQLVNSQAPIGLASG